MYTLYTILCRKQCVCMHHKTQRKVSVKSCFFCLHLCMRQQLHSSDLFLSIIERLVNLYKRVSKCLLYHYTTMYNEYKTLRLISYRKLEAIGKILLYQDIIELVCYNKRSSIIFYFRKNNCSRDFMYKNIAFSLRVKLKAN